MQNTRCFSNLHKLTPHYSLKAFCAYTYEIHKARYLALKLKPLTHQMASNGHNKNSFCLEYSGLSENLKNTFKTFIVGATPIETCAICALIIMQLCAIQKSAQPTDHGRK